MKKLLGAATFAAIAVAAGGAYAETVDISAVSAKYCTAPSSTTVSYLAGEFVDSTTHLVLPTMKTAALGTVACNANAVVSIASSKFHLKDGSGSCAGSSAAFADCVNYTATLAWNTAEWASAAPSFTTNGTAASASASDTTSSADGALTLAITPVPPAKKIQAGTYTDTVTVLVAVAP